jgi:hypothetical protein
VWAWWGRCHCREGLIAAALAWHQPLRPTQMPDVRGDNAVLALKALAFNYAKQMCTVPTSVVPASQKNGFIGIKTVLSAFAHLGFRWRNL